MTSSRYYDRPVDDLTRDMLDVLLAQPGATITKAQITAWFAEHYPRYSPLTAMARVRKITVNSPSRHHYGAKEDGTDDVLYQVGRGIFRRYDPDSDPAPIRMPGFTPGIDDEEGEDLAGIEESDGEFAAEAHLRDALARNMGLIEPGLTLVGAEADAGNGRRIDLLGRAPDGSYVVVELKVSKGYDRVVGQLLRYRNWVSKTMANGRSVRGVIVAREISEDLRLACAGLPDVRLVEYTMSVQLSDVTEVG